MRPRTLFLLFLALACSTPGSRIRRNQAAFDSYPVEVQERIRAGQVDVGFSAEQVLMAVGKPDRRTKRASASGEETVWVYGGGGGPGVGIGIGAGYGSGGGVFGGGGVSVGGPGRSGTERLRVVLKDGVVTSVEGR